MTGVQGVSAIILIVFFLVLYFLPWLVAVARKHHQMDAILMLNLFLGWTFLGWVASLIWSFTAVKVVKGVKPVDVDDEIECPQCAEMIKKKAKVCRYCGFELAPAKPQEETGSLIGADVDDVDQMMAEIKAEASQRDKAKI